MIIKLLYTNESFYAVFVYKLPLYFYTLYLALFSLYFFIFALFITATKRFFSVDNPLTTDNGLSTDNLKVCKISTRKWVCLVINRSSDPVLQYGYKICIASDKKKR